MASIGTIRQYRPPFSGDKINTQGNLKIGISIGQKDYMSWKQDSSLNQRDPLSYDATDKDFYFYIYSASDNISNKEKYKIHMGRTCMYETQQAINNAVIQFPSNPPKSVLVETVQCEPN